MDAPRDGTPFSRADSAIGSDVTFSRATTNVNTPEPQEFSINAPGRDRPLSSEHKCGDSIETAMAAMTDERKRKHPINPSSEEMRFRKAVRLSREPRPKITGMAYYNHSNETSIPKSSDESMSREPQIGSAEHPEVIEEVLQDTVDQKVAKVLEVAGTTTEDAHDLLRKSRGDVQEAVGRFYERKSPTLIEEALPAMELGKCSKTRRKFLRNGDVLVVLDCNNLGLSCRLRAEDLRASSSWFAESLSSADATFPGPEDVKYLYTLQSPLVVGGVPELLIRDLQAMKQDCIGLNRSKPETGGFPEQTLSKKETKKPVKQEDHGEAEAAAAATIDARKITDWLKAYEAFLRIISHASPKHLLLDQDSVNRSLPRIEAVSKLAHFYEAHATGSPVTSALTVLFDGYDERTMLWASVAGHAVRWLAIGANLKKVSIYKEAFVHVTSAYLMLADVLSERGVPDIVRARVEHRAREMEYQRISVNSHLLSFTIRASEGREEPVSPSTDFLAYSVLVFYKEWIAEHLRFHDSETTKSQTSAFCDHEEQDCLQPAEFHRLIGGTDDYLPEAHVFAAVTRRHSDGRRDSARDLDPDKKEFVRATMKTIKGRAAEIVKPIITSTLRWAGKDSLPYLTSLRVDDEDYPWKAEVKQEDMTSEESEDEDTDMED